MVFMQMLSGPLPKTITVVSEEHDGQTVTINEADFDETKHKKVSKGRAKLADKSEAKEEK